MFGEQILKSGLMLSRVGDKMPLRSPGEREHEFNLNSKERPCSTPWLELHFSKMDFNLAMTQEI